VSSPTTAWKRRAALLLAEPTFRFFVVGALLFAAHRLVVGNPRVVIVTPGVKADLARKFRDNNGRAPSPAELDGELRAWERDEALYREALRDRLDRNDATIRTVLADRVRARAAVGFAKREPTAAELDGWLATHRSLYETPRRYDYGTIVFPKADPSSPAELDRYQRALKEKDGAAASGLGRPIVGGDLTAEELGKRVGAPLAGRIVALPVGQWRRLESDEALLLARVNAVEGGLPSAGVLRQRMVADWQLAQQRRAVDQELQAIVDRYRFEERP
jgi:hypothetical protein